MRCTVNVIKLESSGADVAILPRCSLSETLEGAFGCANNFLGGFPYNDEAMCR